MVKPLTDLLQAHLKLPVQTLAQCLRIEGQDGVVLGLTEHDRDLVFEGVVYQSVAGYTPTAIQTSSQLSVGTVEIEGILSAIGVQASSIAAGLFDHARIEVFEVNYLDLSQGKLPLFSGFWGETTWQDHRFTTEFLSISDVLQQPFGELYSPICRAQLGDARCGVNLRKFTVTAEVTEVMSNREFIASCLLQPLDYFKGGIVTWLTGENKAQCGEVKAFQQGGYFQLGEAMLSPLCIGDTFKVQTGCDKQFVTCRTLYNNGVNFRGEPFVPGEDTLLHSSSPL